MQTENRNQKIAVTGATGRLGSHLVEILEQRGHDVVPIARSKGVDVVSGEGLDEALAGVDTIIDTATGPTPDQEEETAFFTASARNLQRAGAAAGAKRIVVVSIIGIDKFQGGYNAAKMVQEQTLLEGPLPVRIVRAAQFHEFFDQLVGWMIRDGVAYLPEMRTQPVAASVVAETLADAAEEPEIEDGRISEVAGPQDERLADVAAALFASRGESVEIREGRQPDDPDAAAYAEGAVLPNPGAKLAGPSFEEWLAAARTPGRRPSRTRA
jgi:Predicted nucleoside-diphosphate-sugar epimerases